jgi:hypothetical protein
VDAGRVLEYDPGAVILWSADSVAPLETVTIQPIAVGIGEVKTEVPTANVAIRIDNEIPTADGIHRSVQMGTGGGCEYEGQENRKKRPHLNCSSTFSAAIGAPPGPWRR